MENASKALIIAGAILISIVIISLGVFIFSKWRDTVMNNNDIDDQARMSFNSEITPYLGKKIVGAQVNSLIQKAIAINNIAIRNKDTVKVIKITYTNENKVLKVEGNSLKRGLTRVDAVKYYIVNGEFDDNGLITDITITDN